jgi:predicted secreted protein
MSISSSIVLYCVIWALVFYVVNPLWQRSQSEQGEVTPGTPASAPVDAMLKKKAVITTIVATALFVVAFCAIEFEWLTLDQISFLTPPSQQ